jgi:outer membrane receptor protein involved in Fe transport
MTEFHKLGAALTAAVSVVAIATPAQAQQRQFNIPAGPLADALDAFVAQSGAQLIYQGSELKSARSPGAVGRMDPAEALKLILKGTGYTSVQDSSGARAIVRRAEGNVPPLKEDATPTRDSTAITVTGTRIRGAASASRVITVTRRSLEQQGVTDLAAFTRILPQNYTGGQNPGIAGGGEQGGQDNVNNSAALNLRGLGPDATLTLLNGHRLAYDSLDQGIDIAAIPLAAIDRIEVVADGSSALYGSDAVGGVANIILRRDYEGAETTARIGGSSQGGNFQQEYSFLGGHRWSSGGFMATIDWTSATPIYAGQRGYTRTVDPSLTLTLRNRQLSGVITGHQHIAKGVTVDLDGYVMERHSLKQNPFLPDESVFLNGLVSHPNVRSYALTPTVRVELGPWQAAFSATHAVSSTRLATANYFSGSSPTAILPSKSRLIYENRMSGIEANAEGPLVALPGGDARLAIGGGLRKLTLYDDIADVVDGDIVPYSSFTERRDVQFAYGELSLPLVSHDVAFPLINRLTLSGALRYERWKGIGSVTTPKIGLIYQPDSDLTLRATWGKSFKAPTLYQMNEVRQGALIPGFYFSPPPQPAGSTVLFLGGGNPDLKPEHATTWSTSIELAPHLLPGFDLQASYFNIDYRGRIASPLASPLTALYDPQYSNLIIYNPSVADVNAVIATLPQGLLNETGAPFDPSNVGAIMDETIRNTERQRIKGVDLGADYRVELENHGRLLFTGAASYLKSEQQLTPGLPSVKLAGTIFNPPHWRGRGGAVWDSGWAAFSAFVNCVGSRMDNRFPTVATISPFVTLDVNASLRSGATNGAFRNLEIMFSALNVLNEKPHFIRNSEVEGAPYDSTNESPVGRFLGVSLRKIW